MFSRISEQFATTTADQVRVELTVAVRYRAPFHYAVVPEPARDFSDARAAEVRFRSSIGAAVRARVASLSFEELHGKRAGVASAVRHELGPVMRGIGYQLLHARITDSFRSEATASCESDGKGATPAARARAGAASGDAGELSRWQSEGGGA
jgi:regulator of protease activity HflC (stomatin/prohibitin superfamily)